MSKQDELPIPPFFEPEKAGEVWRVPYQQRAADAREWSRIHGLRPAKEDEVRVCLIAVDCQNTFCIPDFELFVAGRSGTGAVEDNVRLCEFIYRNLGIITEIHLTLDTHRAVQIFHPAFWVNRAGDNPEPMTVVTVEDVEEGRWSINPAVAGGGAGRDLEALGRYALHYVRELRDRGKYDLTIWPYHAMLGGVGHALASCVEEAVFFHNLARCAQSRFEIKGENTLTEHYSVLRPEVLFDGEGNPVARKNISLIEELWTFDFLVVAGQAKSHCVAWTLDNLLQEIEAKTADLAAKVYLLEDCCSPVVVPGLVDFTDHADATFQRLADAGMNRVRSTDPIRNWPGIEF